MEDVAFYRERCAPLGRYRINQLVRFEPPFIVVRFSSQRGKPSPQGWNASILVEAFMFKALLSLFVISILTGCASADFGSPNTYQRYDVQRIGQMEQATVIRVRAITIESNSDSSGLSSIVSSVAGAFLGSQVIGNGRGRYISGALSGSATGVIAQRVSSMMSHRSGLEVFLLRGNGQTVVVSQVDDQQFVPGEHVYLVNSGSRYRITH